MPITALEAAPVLLLDPSGGAEPRASAPAWTRCEGNTKQEKKAAGYDRAFPLARWKVHRHREHPAASSQRRWVTGTNIAPYFCFTLKWEWVLERHCVSPVCILFFPRLSEQSQSSLGLSRGKQNVSHSLRRMNVSKQTNKKTFLWKQHVHFAECAAAPWYRTTKSDERLKI